MLEKVYIPFANYYLIDNVSLLQTFNWDNVTSKLLKICQPLSKAKKKVKITL